jgi:hypothetical protein
MNRYFPIFHGLHERAPWGIAVERAAGTPKVELLLLCRTEQEAVQYAGLTSLGQGVKAFRDEKVAEREGKTRGN